MNLTRDLLSKVHSKTSGLCWYCGVFLPHFSDWQVDHQNPVSKGGSNALDNLVAACRGCNSRKRDRTIDEYRHSLIVKLEHQISSAWEFAHEITPLISESNYPESDTPLIDLLYTAASTACGLKLLFYGEKFGAVASQEVIRLETEA